MAKPSVSKANKPISAEDKTKWQEYAANLDACARGDAIDGGEDGEEGVVNVDAPSDERVISQREEAAIKRMTTRVSQLTPAPDSLGKFAPEADLAEQHDNRIAVEHQPSHKFVLE